MDSLIYIREYTTDSVICASRITPGLVFFVGLSPRCWGWSLCFSFSISDGTKPPEAHMQTYSHDNPILVPAK